MVAQGEKRVVREVKRRRPVPQFAIHVIQPGTIIVTHGTRIDLVDAPEGSRIERIEPQEILTPPAQAS